ncbi:lipopolysaccharide assembly protein LapA domain-containing protein [Pseudomonas sp. S3E12]|uniref:lipopolysaccharide assembly protein LapA domain-containing protein n=1 Tax=Pseudomonas sp. S3E12 TaxID=1873126 RepID=UPI00081C1F74|nr:LapA family protein [Pseudomonas sp. S3E12]OCW24944.1 hypothetical protein BB029_11800 [Pseudomonas sp. S3E12]
MRGVKRVSLVLVILALVLVTLAFVLENQQGVTLSFLGWNTAQLPVAVFITLALIAGMLISPLLGAMIRLAGRRKPIL